MPVAITLALGKFKATELFSRKVSSKDAFRC
jgi:hypothetical protein